MDLIERYVQEVARRLPSKQREDVARELRSSLEDSLEGRTGAPLEEVGERAAIDLLLEFGSPRATAASYRSGPAYLVGPVLYPSFITTMKICLTVVGGLILVSTLIDAVGSSGSLRHWGILILQAISGLQSAFISVLGIVVLVFAIIERVRWAEGWDEEEWDPRDLPPLIEDRGRVDVTGEIVGMALATLGLLLINFTPEWLRAQVWVNDVRYSLPLVGPGVQAHLAWLNAYLVLGVALGIVVVRHGRWNAASRAADVVISFLLVVFFWRMLHANEALLPDAPALIEQGWPERAATDFAALSAELLAPLLWWGFVAALLAAAWGSTAKLIRLGRSSTGSPRPT